MYGLTEAFRSTYLPPEEVDRRPDSIGKAIPNAEILVLREDGTPCAPDEPGELVHRGALVAHGLLERSGEDRRALQAAARARARARAARDRGVLRRHGAHGRGGLPLFHRPPRRDDQDVRLSREPDRDRGSALRARSSSAKCAAFGVPHPTLGQAIVVVATPRAGERARRDAAAGASAASDCRPTWCPRTIEIRPGPLPRNPNGKIDRKALAAEFADAVRRRRHDATPPARADARWFPVVDDCLRRRRHAAHAARRSASGRTPFYAYDRALIDARVARAAAARCRAAIKLHYAMKANPMPALVGFMAGWSTASTSPRAASCGSRSTPAWTPREISFAGPGKSEAELAQAVAAGILVNVESTREVELLARLVARLGRAGARRGARQSRLRAEVLGHEDGRRAQAVRRRRRGRAGAARRDRPRSASPSRAFTSTAARRTCGRGDLRGAAARPSSSRSRLAEHAPAPVRVLNIGGGFGIPYFPGRGAARPRADRREPRASSSTRAPGDAAAGADS